MKTFHYTVSEKRPNFEMV